MNDRAENMRGTRRTLRDEYGVLNFHRIAGQAGGHQLDLARDVSASSGALALTQAAQDVPGCTYTAEKTGTYLVLGAFHFSITVTGVAACIGALVVDGVAASGAAIYNDSATGSVTATQAWIVEASEGDVIKLQGSKFAAGGTAAVGATNTTLTVVQIG